MITCRGTGIVFDLPSGRDDKNEKWGFVSRKNACRYPTGAIFRALLGSHGAVDITPHGPMIYLSYALGGADHIPNWTGGTRGRDEWTYQ